MARRKEHAVHTRHISLRDVMLVLEGVKHWSIPFFFLNQAIQQLFTDSDYIQLTWDDGMNDNIQPSSGTYDAGVWH